MATAEEVPIAVQSRASLQNRDALAFLTPLEPPHHLPVLLDHLPRNFRKITFASQPPEPVNVAGGMTPSERGLRTSGNIVMKNRILSVVGAVHPRGSALRGPVKGRSHRGISSPASSVATRSPKGAPPSPAPPLGCTADL